ncbi:hypothetical protein [Embleya sp. NPDC001921]
MLQAATSLPQAEAEWCEAGAAWLRPGLHFAAVDIPSDFVHAAVERRSPAECPSALTEALGGPIYYNPRGIGDEPTYTALLPTSVHWSWRAPGTWVHTTTSVLLMPAPDRCEPVEEGPWWVAPLRGAGQVCDPDQVKAFVALGAERVGGFGVRGA